MNKLTHALIAVFAASVFNVATCIAQPASYFEGGVMRPGLRKSGHYQSDWMPGFSVAISGLEISMYGGQFARKDFPDSSSLRVNGGFWNIGYIWRSPSHENFKRFHYTLGFGVGGYGIREMNGFQFNLHPGIQVDLTRWISISASAYAGYNYYLDTDTTLSWNNNGYLSTRKWFFNPTLTLRINTNPMAVMGESYARSSYWGGGMVEEDRTAREGDYNVTRHYSYYLPAGEYISDAIITSTNYFNLYGKMLVGAMKNYKGNSLAFGGGAAIRAGLLCLDLEYLQGKIGFHQSKVGAPTDQWKMRRTSVGIGFNWFNIPFPFKGPSLVRLILGARLGILTLDSNRPQLVQGEPNPEELFKSKFWSPMLTVEFGTLGINLEFFNQKENGYASGLILGATYLLPLKR